MQALNRAIFLNKSHRFKEDEQFGKVLRRLRHGNITIDDIKWINERFVENNNVSLPNADKIRYACNTNEHRNAVSNALFIYLYLFITQRLIYQKLPAGFIVGLLSSCSTRN